jgi:mannosidase alpha-like ER degradation enhancer 2
MTSGKRTATRFGALEAFFPATLALSGDTVRASRLMSSVESMWTQFGIEPEELDYATMAITYPGYQLRPEALESAYYLFSFTERRHYRDAGRAMLEAIERWTVTDAGFASLRDVRTKAKQDRMHSFLFAETLKYAYLLFASKAPINLETVVFNTEAHPLRRTW